jgi:7,8-dihydroneopterin aldolase/epimerase/oxygenase
MMEMIPIGYDQIILKGMIFHGHVGVHPSEKEHGQDFQIDVTLSCRPLDASRSDKLDQTIDYGRVYQLSGDIVKNACFDLIERLADEIAGRLLDAFGLAEMIDVTVSKPHAPMPGRFTSMGVHIVRKRS